MAKSLKLIVEALLFTSDEPLSVKDIQAVLSDARPADIKSALRVLRYEYEAMGRSFILKEVAGGYQLRSRSEYGPYILKMRQSSPDRLSRASLETLAIIAYKQPILRQEIERLRGVDVGGILRTLLEKGLIRIMGRKDLPGRPLIYGTTKRFLEVFDLRDIESLPKLKEIKSLGAEEDEGGAENGKIREEDANRNLFIREPAEGETAPADPEAEEKPEGSGEEDPAEGDAGEGLPPEGATRADGAAEGEEISGPPAEGTTSPGDSPEGEEDTGPPVEGETIAAPPDEASLPTDED
ncbi:MAG: SMC-Scp complex subunit ScpB [Deltaproteobacteria bacterium]|nr:SMC-Scp complex subunit ScpB [Deltaproteobacteria bacterium]